MATANPGGSGTGESSSERQSINTACPARPVAEINWSMMPQFTPTQRFSARWPSLAMGTGSQGQPETAAKARAVATSRAAEEESPAPWGTSPSSTPCQARKA